MSLTPSHPLPPTTDAARCCNLWRLALARARAHRAIDIAMHRLILSSSAHLPQTLLKLTRMLRRHHTQLSLGPLTLRT